MSQGEALEFLTGLALDPNMEFLYRGLALWEIPHHLPGDPPERDRMLDTTLDILADGTQPLFVRNCASAAMLGLTPENGPGVYVLSENPPRYAPQTATGLVAFLDDNPRRAGDLPAGGRPGALHGTYIEDLERSPERIRRLLDIVEREGPQGWVTTGILRGLYKLKHIPLVVDWARATSNDPLWQAAGRFFRRVLESE